jgi:peptide-methionine (S)-S-oxide reductase
MFAKAFFLSAATIAAALTTSVGVASAKTQQAIFAGGCFWCVESDFDHVPGVISTTSGYTGGTSDNPTYEDHTAAGHREAVRIEFDDAKVSYEKLLDVFWHSVDPTDGGGQFCDRGHSYTTAIYAVGKDQLAAAQKSKAQVAGLLKQSIATEIAAAPAFWPAETYHQDYYRKNPLRYKYYRYACGRDARIEAVWGEAAHQGIATH